MSLLTGWLVRYHSLLSDSDTECERLPISPRKVVFKSDLPITLCEMSSIVP